MKITPGFWSCCMVHLALQLQFAFFLTLACLVIGAFWKNVVYRTSGFHMEKIMQSMWKRGYRICIQYSAWLRAGNCISRNRSSTAGEKKGTKGDKPFLYCLKSILAAMHTYTPFHLVGRNLHKPSWFRVGGAPSTSLSSMLYRSEVACTHRNNGGLLVSQLPERLLCIGSSGPGRQKM